MDTKQVIVVRKDLNMRKGKIAAQVAHASMKFLADVIDERVATISRDFTAAEKAWLGGAFAKVVVGCDSEAELRALIALAVSYGITVKPIIDAGRTEFHGVPTLTCAAFGPDDVEQLNHVTGHLKLL